MVSALTTSARLDTVISPADGVGPRSADRQGGRRALRTIRIRDGLRRLALFAEDFRRRGIGSRVLVMAEEEERRRGCTRITLTTLSVEAPGFYKKQGYDIAATVDCDPPGLTRY